MKRLLLIVIAVVLISGTVFFLTSEEEHNCQECVNKAKTEQQAACGSDDCCAEHK